MSLELRGCHYQVLNPAPLENIHASYMFAKHIDIFKKRIEQIAALHLEIDEKFSLPEFEILKKKVVVVSYKKANGSSESAHTILNKIEEKYNSYISLFNNLEKFNDKTTSLWLDTFNGMKINDPAIKKACHCIRKWKENKCDFKGLSVNPYRCHPNTQVKTESIKSCSSGLITEQETLSLDNSQSYQVLAITISILKKTMDSLTEKQSELLDKASSTSTVFQIFLQENLIYESGADAMFLAIEKMIKTFESFIQFYENHADRISSENYNEQFISRLLESFKKDKNLSKLSHYLIFGLEIFKKNTTIENVFTPFILKSL